MSSEKYYVRVDLEHPGYIIKSEEQDPSKVYKDPSIVGMAIGHAFNAESGYMVVQMLQGKRLISSTVILKEWKDR